MTATLTLPMIADADDDCKQNYDDDYDTDDSLKFTFWATSNVDTDSSTIAACEH